MISSTCLKAIETGLKHPRVILKHISPNDVGLTGGHQYGYYLPKNQWTYFDTVAPRKGENRTRQVEINWQGDFVTQSTVKWYGKGSRSEYRITKFGRNFPYLDHNFVGFVLALVFESTEKIHAFVLESDEDAEAIQETLGISIFHKWEPRASERQYTEDQCLDTAIRRFVAELNSFPKTNIMAEKTKDLLIDCARGFLRAPSDVKLAKLIDVEFRLFREIEKHLMLPKVRGPFHSMEAFLIVAQSILQSRKSRAGKSLEHHVKFLLQDAGLPFDAQSTVDGSKPDIIIPGKTGYEDLNFPESKLFVLALKTTCKDRWRQVIQEAPRIRQKHLLTLQEGISVAQMAEMTAAHVTLVVPESLHPKYRGAPSILSIEQFIEKVRRAMAA